MPPVLPNFKRKRVNSIGKTVGLSRSWYCMYAHHSSTIRIVYHIQYDVQYMSGSDVQYDPIWTHDKILNMLAYMYIALLFYDVFRSSSHTLISLGLLL